MYYHRMTEMSREKNEVKAIIHVVSQIDKPYREARMYETLQNVREK